MNMDFDRTVEEVEAVVASDIRTEFAGERLYATPENMRRLHAVIANAAASLMSPPVDVDAFLQDFDVLICERTSTVSITRKRI